MQGYKNDEPIGEAEPFDEKKMAELLRTGKADHVRVFHKMAEQKYEDKRKSTRRPGVKTSRRYR